jgi:hypothetical protein
MISLNGNTLNINVFFNEYDAYETYEYSLRIAKSFSINKTSDLEWRLLKEEIPTSVTPQTIGANISFEDIPYNFIPYSMYNFVHVKVVITGIEGVHEIYAGCVSDNRYNQILYNNNECETYYKGRKCLLSPFENKKKLNLLMIGSSFCYYYVKELVAIAATIGIDLTIGNIYHSGAKIGVYGDPTKDAYDKWITSDPQTKALNLYITDKTERKTALGGSSSEYKAHTFNECISYRTDWDIITIQHHFGASDKLQDCYNNINEGSYGGLQIIINKIKEYMPNAILGMQEEWAYGLGHEEIDGDEEKQEKTYRVIQNVTKRIANEYKLFYVPTGDAWQYARKNTLVGDNLNRRILGPGFNVLTTNPSDTGVGDYYHDGDIGGGRYLNACVWFEILFGQSCIGNTYRPEYPVTSDKAPNLDPNYNKINSSNTNDNEEYIKILQEAAHKAVLLM